MNHLFRNNLTFVFSLIIYSIVLFAHKTLELSNLGFIFSFFIISISLVGLMYKGKKKIYEILLAVSIISIILIISFFLFWLLVINMFKGN